MTTTVTYFCGIPGLTLTAQVYAEVGDAVALATLTLEEDDNRPGAYSAPTSVSGRRWFRILNGTAPFDSVWAIISGTNVSLGLHPPEDPLLSEVPDSYPVGSAGEILGNLAETVVIALSRSVAVTGPRPQVGACIHLVKGDDYYDDDGRAIELSITDEDLPSWEDDSPALAVIDFIFTVNARSVTVAGIFDERTGSPRTVKCEIPKAVSNTLGVGKGTYNIVVTLANDHITTVVKDASLEISD